MASNRSNVEYAKICVRTFVAVGFALPNAFDFVVNSAPKGSRSDVIFFSGHKRTVGMVFSFVAEWQLAWKVVNCLTYCF